MSDSTNAERNELAIFPLNLVLFPDGVLPLKIFEQRYVEMTKACLRDELPFGVCRIRQGQEVGTPAEYEPVGCSARIKQWDMPHPGLFHLACSGERVFRVVTARVDKSGLIIGQVEWLTSEAGATDAHHLDACRNILEALIKRAGEDVFGGSARLDDPEWVSYRIAELLPVDSQIKQTLLEQRSTGERLASIAGMLYTA